MSALTIDLDTLKATARESLIWRETLNDSNGFRATDPLRQVIPGDGMASPEAWDYVEAVIGHDLDRTAWNGAPHLRSQLRRWAHRDDHERSNR